MTAHSIRRRSFLTLLGGAAAAWPLAAGAQQDGRVRRVGVLFAATENNPQTRESVAALRDGLGKLAWNEGRNLRLDMLFGAGDLERIRTYAAELVSLAPDAIVTSGTPATQAVARRTRTIPIVMSAGGDPVVNGLVQNIARPEGNITGFTNQEASLVGKWLELLKEAVPGLMRVAVIFNPELATPIVPSYLASIDLAARALALPTVKVPVRNAIEAVHALDAFAAEPNGGLLVVPPPAAIAYLETTIIQLAAHHRLPAVYPGRPYVAAGGLMCYATSGTELARSAAIYVNRILRGAKVSELPVQFPTKFELVINLKTARAIGLTIPESFLLRADELIE